METLTEYLRYYPLPNDEKAEEPLDRNGNQESRLSQSKATI